jgi:hypothetical protein
MTFKTPAAVLVAFSVLAIADAGEAGQTFSAGASCSANPDGSGSCRGSYNGFLAATDTSAYAAFWNEGATYGVFVAELNGSYYSCTTSSPGSAWFAISAGSPTLSFSVSWDNTGTCNAVSMESGSQFK